MADDPQVLTGAALNKRAAELDIEGRSELSADDLRAKIAEVEAQQAATDDTPPVDPPAEPVAEGEFTVADLLATPRYVGYDAGAVAGAFHGVDPSTVLSLDEAKRQVERWHESPADQDPETAVAE